MHAPPAAAHPAPRRVHERNVEELMLAALPYHETEQFVRLVQVGAVTWMGGCVLCACKGMGAGLYVSWLTSCAPARSHVLAILLTITSTCRLQVLRLEPRSRWGFLEPMRASGAPAPREVLVLRCITDRVSGWRRVADVCDGGGGCVGEGWGDP